jgi:DNA recombination-dependent growth factor C
MIQETRINMTSLTSETAARHYKNISTIATLALQLKDEIQFLQKRDLHFKYNL